MLRPVGTTTSRSSKEEAMRKVPGLLAILFSAVVLSGCPFDPFESDDCMDSAWGFFGFKNQGQCIRFVETGQDSR
jgi:hypothetical protein